MQQGFDHQYGHFAWGIDYYTKTIEHNAPARFAVYDWHRNEVPIQEAGYVTDLIAVIVAWGTDDPAGDLDNNRLVDIDDLVGVILNWGQCEGG